MAQTLHKIEADSLEDAYEEMVRTLGRDSVVLHTSEERARGLWGMLGRRAVELIVATPEREPAARCAKVGSDETVNETIQYFKRLVGEAQARMVAPAPAARPEKPTVVPFRPRSEADPEVRDLRSDLHEMREMREMREVYMAGNPAAGLPEEAAPYYRRLADHGVPPREAAALLAGVLQSGNGPGGRAARPFAERLKIEIQKRVPVTGGIRLEPGACRTVALVGPTGVGKTTNLAKLAAQFAVRERARVALVTLDTYRVAAPEQLRVYADIIGLPMRVANDAREAAAAVIEFEDCDLVLVDTAGSSPFNVAQIAELEDMLEAVHPDEVVLVMSAHTRPEEARGMIENYRRLDPASLLFSKLDETWRYGALFSLGAEVRLPLSYFSTGQNVPDDIELATPGKVAKLLMEDGGNRGRPSAQSS